MTSQPLRQLITVLHGCIKGGNHSRALRLLITNLPRTRGDYRLRRYVADTLVALEKNREAAEIYEILVRHFTNIGEPLTAVFVARKLAEIEPDVRSHLDHIASVYAANSPFLEDDAPGLQALPEPEAALDLSGTEPDLPQESLIGVAHELALRKDGFASSPDAVPPILLLSQLEVSLLRRVLDCLQPVSFGDDQPLLVQGQPPGHIVWTVSGRVRVNTAEGQATRIDRQLLLGHGLLFSTRPIPSRLGATTVGHVEALTLAPDAIAELRGERKLLAAAAQLDLGARVDYAVDACGLFQMLLPEERAEALKVFKPCLVPPDTVLIPEGAQGRGVWLVVAGKVDVNKLEGDVAMTIRTLGPGDVVGEISLVTEGPAVATVVTEGPTRLLYAPREEFLAVAARHPEILDRLREAAATRLLDP